MKKLVVLLCLACLVFASGAIAQIDPDEDRIGVYFDTGATIYCIDYPAGGPQPAYLCLTNPSYLGADGEAVSGWECNLEITEGVFILEVDISNGVNVGTPPDFIVGLVTPLPWSPVIVLATAQIGVFTLNPINFTLHPASPSSFDPPSPGYAAGDDPGLLIPLGYSAGGEVVCAGINDPECESTVVPTEDATWGGVKSMYK